MSASLALGNHFSQHPVVLVREHIVICNSPCVVLQYVQTTPARSSMTCTGCRSLSISGFASARWRFVVFMAPHRPIWPTAFIELPAWKADVICGPPLQRLWASFHLVGGPLKATARSQWLRQKHGMNFQRLSIMHVPTYLLLRTENTPFSPQFQRKLTWPSDVCGCHLCHHTVYCLGSL